MLNRSCLLLAILLLANALALDATSRAQTSQPSFDAAISQLAALIAYPLQKAGVTKVVFADLKGPDGQKHPAGRWLADQLADACNKGFPGLEVIIRPKNEEAAQGVDEAGNQKGFKSVEEWARGIGANLVVTGSFARLSDGIGISLSALTSSDSPHSIAQATGIVPVTNEITSLSGEPLPALKGQFPRAGVAGFGVPDCVYCPPPEYTKKARAAKLVGTAVLQVIITADGHATDISVKRSLDADLDAQAIKAVSKWRFKPAIGPRGQPVSVICPIEVTFRLY